MLTACKAYDGTGKTGVCGVGLFFDAVADFVFACDGIGKGSCRMRRPSDFLFQEFGLLGGHGGQNLHDGGARHAVRARVEGQADARERCQVNCR